MILDGDAEIQTIDTATLDRVHAAMLWQTNGQANTIRTQTGTGQDRGPDSLRLANALSAIYPRPIQEPFLLDAIRLAVSR